MKKIERILEKPMLTVKPVSKVLTSDKPNLIAICGNNHGAGKTTLANVFLSLLPYECVVMSFASPLKAMISRLIEYTSTDKGITAVKDIQDKEAPLEAFSGHSLRYTMQSLGTGWGRALMGNDFWANILIKSFENMKCTQNTVLIIDDMRFMNEYNILKEKFRPLFVFIDNSQLPDPEPFNSEGEICLAFCDVVVQNTGDYADLCNTARRIISAYFGNE